MYSFGNVFLKCNKYFKGRDATHEGNNVNSKLNQRIVLIHAKLINSYRLTNITPQYIIFPCVAIP